LPTTIIIIIIFREWARKSVKIDLKNVSETNIFRTDEDGKIPAKKYERLKLNYRDQYENAEQYSHLCNEAKKWHLGSTCIKAASIMLMKLTLGVLTWNFTTHIGFMPVKQ